MTEPKQMGWGALSLVVLCCVLWGANSVAVKITVDRIPPVGSAGCRFFISMIVLGIWARFEGTSLQIRKLHIAPLLISGMLLFAQILTFHVGTAWTLAGRSSVFINVHPFVVALLAWVFLKEKIGVVGLAGLLIAMAGVVVLMERTEEEREASLRGDLTIILSAVILGIMVVYQKRILSYMNPNHIVFWQGVIALPLFFAYSGVWEGFESYNFDAESIIALLFQGVFVSGFCFAAWIALLRTYPANQLSAYAFLVPIFGIALGCLIRGEPLTINLVAGGACVGMGLYLVNRPRPSMTLARSNAQTTSLRE